MFEPVELMPRHDNEVSRIGAKPAVVGVVQRECLEALRVSALADVARSAGPRRAEVMDAFVYLAKKCFVVCELPGGQLIQLPLV